MKKAFFIIVLVGALFPGVAMSYDIVMESIGYEKNCIEIVYGAWGGEKKGEVRFEVTAKSKPIGESRSKTSRYSKSVDGVIGRGNTIMFCMQPGTEYDVSELDVIAEMWFGGKQVDSKKLYMFRATPR
jgi:hypothetical protein